MCFSAETSFVASGALGIAGVVALKNVREPAQIMLAGIPLIFSVQQLSEGLVWLSFTHPGFSVWRPLFTYVFLFFAVVVWPIWIPYATWLPEKEARRKTVIFFLLLCGLVVAGIIAYGLVFYPVLAEIRLHHIHYKLDFKQVLVVPRGIVYFMPSVFPPLMASNRKVRVFGLSLLGSYVVARFNYPYSVLSVWCYFAAVISLIIIWIVSATPRPAVTGMK